MTLGRTRTTRRCSHTTGAPPLSSRRPPVRDTAELATRARLAFRDGGRPSIRPQRLSRGRRAYYAEALTLWPTESDELPEVTDRIRRALYVVDDDEQERTRGRPQRPCSKLGDLETAARRRLSIPIGVAPRPQRGGAANTGARQELVADAGTTSQAKARGALVYIARTAHHRRRRCEEGSASRATPSSEPRNSKSTSSVPCAVDRRSARRDSSGTDRGRGRDARYEFGPRGQLSIRGDHREQPQRWRLFSIRSRASSRSLH